MPDARSRPERAPAERLPLGQASRLLGVDPDTLRRWADEGRVPAFTTLGGHRRFERRTLERLVAARRTGAVGALGGVGDTTDRLSAAYRRRYGELGGDGPDLRSIVPEAAARRVPRSRPAPRRRARPLPRRQRPGQGRRGGRGRRAGGAARGARPAARDPDRGRRVDVRRGPSPVPRRAAARRPAERGQRGRRRAALRRLDRPPRPPPARVRRGARVLGRGRRSTPRPRRAHERPAARPDLGPGGPVRGDAARPVARPAPRVPARLGVRDGVLRARRRGRGGRRGPGLERGPVPRVVPDRRHLDGRLARPRDGVPAGPDAVRLHVRRAAPVRGVHHVHHPQLAHLRGRGPAAVPVPVRRHHPVARDRRRDLLREPALDLVRGRRDARGHARCRSCWSSRRRRCRRPATRSAR